MWSSPRDLHLKPASSSASRDDSLLNAAAQVRVGPRTWPLSRPTCASVLSSLYTASAGIPGCRPRANTRPGPTSSDLNASQGLPGSLSHHPRGDIALDACTRQPECESGPASSPLSGHYILLWPTGNPGPPLLDRLPVTLCNYLGVGRRITIVHREQVFIDSKNDITKHKKSAKGQLPELGSPNTTTLISIFSLYIYQ